MLVLYFPAFNLERTLGVPERSGADPLRPLPQGALPGVSPETPEPSAGSWPLRETRRADELSTRRFRTALLHASSVLSRGGFRTSRISPLLDALSCPPHFVLPAQVGLAPQALSALAQDGTLHADEALVVGPDVPPSSQPLLWVWWEVSLPAPQQALLQHLLTVLRRETGHLRLEVWLLNPAQTGLLVPTADALAVRGIGEEPVRVLWEGGETSRSSPPTAPPDTPGTAQAHALGPTAETLEAVVYRLEGTLPPVEEALVLGERVRRALLSLRASGSFSPMMVGKTQDGVPLEGNQHAHFVPLDLDRDGRLDHVLVFAPGGFSAEDQAVLQSLRVLSGNTERGLGVTPVRCGSLDALRRPPELSIFSESSVWISVTPFSLPFFATRGKDKRPRPRDLPMGQVERELSSRGFPRPERVVILPGWEDATGQLHPWGAFRQERLNGTRGKGLSGFRLEFAEPLTGPLFLGFACHFGLGMFEPCR